MNTFQIRMNTGERPDFITAEDITRWDYRLDVLRRLGAPRQLELIAMLDATENGLEFYYTGEWLGEQLKAFGFTQRERSAICYLHGQMVAAGTVSGWDAAIEVARELEEK